MIWGIIVSPFILKGMLNNGNHKFIWLVPLTNVLVSGFFTIGFLSSAFAGFASPDLIHIYFMYLLIVLVFSVCQSFWFYRNFKRKQK